MRRVAAALLLCACGSCATAPNRPDAVSELGDAISGSRDAGEHAGPRFRDLPPQLAEAARNATDDESFRRSLVKLLDQLQDGHATVDPDRLGSLAVARGVALTEVDGVVWLGFWDSIDGPGDLTQWNAIEPPAAGGWLHIVRDWMRLERIDDYAPRHLQAAIRLLEGPPGTSVEVSGTAVDGTKVCRSIERADPDTSVMLTPGALHGLAHTYLTLSGFAAPQPPSATAGGKASDEPFVWSACIGPQGRVGYLRLARMHSSEAHLCSDDSRGCDDRRAIAAAIDPLLGCDTIMLDLGGNSGGVCRHGAEVMRRLLPRSLERVPFVHVGPEGESARWRVEPPECRFSGRLVVIADAGTCSAAEHLVNILKGEPSVTVVGSPTGGFEFSVHPLMLRRAGLRLQFGGTPTTWDAPRQSAEGRPVEPDVLVPVQPRVLNDYGPFAAMMQQRIDTLSAAWAAAGLTGPEGGLVADLRSLAPWRFWPALGGVAALASLLLALHVAMRVLRGAPARRAGRSGAARAPVVKA